MPNPPKASDEDIAELIRKGLSPIEICSKLRMHYSAPTKGRFERISRLIQVPIYKHHHRSPTDLKAQSDFTEKLHKHGRADLKVDDGIVLVASDPHYWPDIVSTAHRAFVKFCEGLKPRAVILNGDAFDGATVSRFPRIGWDSRPSVKHELDAVEERLTEIEEAAGTKNLFWPLGNHDARFETFLAAQAPQYEGVTGFHLKDRFPLWKPCWAVWINDSTVVKHRFKGGIHATHNNTLWSGMNMVTGHLHSLKVTPFTDYRATRYGVDVGTLADPYGPQFADYTELNPVNWRSGFAVLTFHKGRLLMPELVLVHDTNTVEWRGGLVEV